MGSLRLRRGVLLGGRWRASWVGLLWLGADDVEGPRAGARSLGMRLILMSWIFLVASATCFDSRTDWTLRLRCSRRFESRLRCFRCSLRRPSMRFNSAASSACCCWRSLASLRAKTARSSSLILARSSASTSSAICLIFCASA